MFDQYDGPPTRTSVPSEVRGVLTVIPRVGAIRLSLSSNSVTSEDSLMLHIAVFDTQSHRIAGVPVGLSWSRQGGPGRYETDSTWLPFCGQSPQTIYATFGALRDSGTVRVLPRAIRRVYC